MKIKLNKFELKMVKIIFFNYHNNTLLIIDMDKDK